MNITSDERAVISRLAEIADIELHLKTLLAETESRIAAAEEVERRCERKMQETRALVTEAVQKVRSDVTAHCENIGRLIAEKTTCFPWLADAISQYHELCDQKIAEFLRAKLRPGTKSAELVSELAREKRLLQRKYLLARNRIRYYEHLFPWLIDFVSEGIDELVAQVDAPPPQEDPVFAYLAPGERMLPEGNRNQLALDRYRTSRKRPWQIGRDYERFVGYLHESQGYGVEYHGIAEGLSDFGRDLYARRERQTLIIQCKCWADHKVIREKHICQLYGTTVEYWLRHRGSQLRELTLFDDVRQRDGIRPVLVSSTSFSPEAVEFAAALGVELHVIPFDPRYPCIKCNVSQKSGERIYHLPMDQQYDSVVIEPERGECYVATVEEAESKRFRRAWRWKGS